MEQTHPTDSDLVLRLQSGEESAFDTLLERYRLPVLNFIFRLIGDATEAEDIAQEAFVRVYQKINTYKPSTKFSTWLFAIARNAAIDRLRYRQRHPTESLAGIVAASPARGPVSNAINSELGNQIAASIQSLPEDQRTAIVLAEYHDMSHAEIAAIMNCSVKSVESRLYRAKQILREKLRGFL